MENLPLTKFQKRIFDLIENTTSNFLICGKPGVGKSVLINALRMLGKKDYILAAPTGLAALNIFGKTLHSIFMLPISQGILTKNFNQFTGNDNVIKFIKHRLRHLIIDEVSMVRADTFDFIDRMLRKIKGVNEPFGGVQIILVGDFYQLPPVVVREEIAQMNAVYDSPFVFSSRVFQEAGFQIEELTEVLRQKGDLEFIEILHAARTGDVTSRHLSTLNKKVCGEIEDLRIRLAGTNALADETNFGRLRDLPGVTTDYTATVFGTWPDMPCGQTKTGLVQLKIGAQVMIKKNGADRPEGDKGPSSVVNGSLGVVTELLKDTVGVKLENGKEVIIYRRLWQYKVKVEVNGKTEEKVVASFEQIPLQLAWAISMHKSQGQSFDKVHIDASKIFAAGQLYVALSRARSLGGLTLQAKLTQDKFKVDQRVVRFFDSIAV